MCKNILQPFQGGDALHISQMGTETQRGQQASRNCKGQAEDANLGQARSGDHALATSPLRPQLLSLGLP